MSLIEGKFQKPPDHERGPGREGPASSLCDAVLIPAARSRHLSRVYDWDRLGLILAHAA
jgi:hypothetical protein